MVIRPTYTNDVEMVSYTNWFDWKAVAVRENWSEESLKASISAVKNDELSLH